MTGVQPEAASPLPAAANAAQRRLLLVGAATLAGELRARLPEHWHITLVTTATALPGERGLSVQTGDGTSALVLERAGAADARVVIAALHDARENLEVCRLARERFDVAQVLALVDVQADTEAYRALRVETVVVGSALATALRNRLERASIAVEGIGLGAGEILQISVHPSSPAIGRALRSFSPQQWTVAAVFRGGQLIIPHGDTVLEAQDSLLLIGQPHVLPAVAEYLRVGRTQFPLPYGINLAAIADGTPLPAMLREVAALAAAARLDHVPVHVIGKDDAETVTTQEGHISFAIHSRSATGQDLLVELLTRRELGCLCLLRRPARVRTRWRRQTVLNQAVRLAKRPIFLPAGTGSYERVVLPIAADLGGRQAAEVAFDVSDMLQVPLSVLLLQPPQWLQQEGETATDWVQEMADLRRQHAEIEVLEGNPLRELLRRAQRHDLVVLGGVAGRRSSPFRPDALSYLADRLPCSAMLVPEASR